MGLPYQQKNEPGLLDLKSVQRLGEGKEWRPLDWTSPAQAPQERIFGSSPRLSSLPISASLGSVREGRLRLSGEGPGRDLRDGNMPPAPGLRRRQELPRVCDLLGLGVF